MYMQYIFMFGQNIDLLGEGSQNRLYILLIRDESASRRNFTVPLKSGVIEGF